MTRILLFVFTLLYLNANAQDTITPVTYGIKTGLTLGTQLFEEDAPIDFREAPGFNIGAFLNYDLSQRAGLRLELMLDVQRNVITVTEGELFGNVIDVRGESRFTQTSLLLPLLFSYDVSHAFTFFLGPQLNNLISSDFEIDKVSRSFNQFSNIENISLGVDVAGGVSYAFTPRMSIEARYYRGLHYRENIKPSVFQFGLAYVL